MVKKTDHKLKFVINDFIDRKRFDEIKYRLRRIPKGIHQQSIKNSNTEIYNDEELLITVYRLGCGEFYAHARNDIEDLLRHIQAADEENDRLKEENEKLYKQLSQIEEELRYENEED